MTMKKILMLTALAASTMFASTALHASPNNGTKYTQTSVAAFRTDSFSSIVYHAGERTGVAVKGDGDTTLHVRVYDENGHLINDDVCRYNTCMATWTPKWTGTFRITVENLGSVYNNYTLVTE